MCVKVENHKDWDIPIRHLMPHGVPLMPTARKLLITTRETTFKSKTLPMDWPCHQWHLPGREGGIMSWLTRVAISWDHLKLWDKHLSLPQGLMFCGRALDQMWLWGRSKKLLDASITLDNSTWQEYWPAIILIPILRCSKHLPSFGIKHGILLILPQKMRTVGSTPKHHMGAILLVRRLGPVT